MKSKIHLFLFSICLILPASAAEVEVPPPHQLLPQGTLAFFTAPDWQQWESIRNNSPQYQLWSDTALQPFKDKFWSQLENEVIDPLEKELDIEFSDYLGLVEGQLTIAVTQNGWSGSADELPGFLFLMDSGEQEEKLKKQLEELKTKWIDADKPIKSSKIRNVEFTTLMIRRDDIAGTFRRVFDEPDGEDNGSGDESDEEPFELTIGQSDSLLLMGTAPDDLEKILVRQVGGPVPAVAEDPTFEADHNRFFRDAISYGWVHFTPIAEIVKSQLAGQNSGEASGPMAISPDKVFSALGFDGLKSLAFSATENKEGTFLQGFLRVPELDRKGLFKILTAESKDASPPPFVPADAVKYQRWRLDGRKAWNTLETMIKEVSPQLSSVLQMTMSAIGKNKDANFDVRKSLIGNLGDDYISYQKNPREYTLEALNSPPSILLMGSPNAEQLANALKFSMALLPQPLNQVEEREFLGRTIYSISLPATTGSGAGGQQRNLSFTSSGGYVAISADKTILEEYLRSSDGGGDSLNETAGLRAAAQKVGGMNTGLFGYENQKETMRTLLRTLKEDSVTLERLFFFSMMGPQQSSDEDSGLNAWLDFSLLPPFEKLEKYFSYMVYAGSFDQDGLGVRMFTPVPPELK